MDPLSRYTHEKPIKNVDPLAERDKYLSFRANAHTRYFLPVNIKR